jgi:GT2 family glycosyltransferase
MEQPLVYALVINWNGMDHVHVCFDTLLQSSYARLRVVLLDNASTDGSAEYVEQTFGADQRMEVWRLGGNLGWGGGNNEGIRRALDAGADFVFLLNNDTWTDPDCVARLVELASATPDAGALAPKMLLFDTPSVVNSIGVALSYVGAAWDIGAGRADGEAYAEVRDVAAVCGGAMFLRASTLRRAGLLDERFGIYYDDVDLCLRIWQQGERCITCPEARVGHKFSASFSGTQGRDRKQFLTERNRLRCLLLNFPLSTFLRYLPAIKLGELRALGSALRKGEWWRVKAQWRAWMQLQTQWPEILRMRRGRFSAVYRKRLGSLLTRDRMFCPAVVLPCQGVYPERELEGARWRPLAPSASLPCTDGKLRLCVANCYLRVCFDGAVSELPPGGMRAGGVHAAWDGSTLSFSGGTLLSAEASGLPYDVAGYLRLIHATGKASDLPDV